MHLKGIMLSEISQAEKYKYCMISHVESKQTILSNTENRLVVARGGEWGREGCRKWVKVVKTQKLPGNKKTSKRCGVGATGI